MSCPAYCVKFSTCINDQEARETEKKLKACWDNIKDIKLDKRRGCYYKYINGVANYYNFGICPECGEVYIDKTDDFPPIYKELIEICRSCKNEEEDV
ncbi:hypothetical protein KKC06_06640 [Patescibacteria group bacterium]|nr:hypothetical protein [Patescibacteria group bacterium]